MAKLLTLVLACSLCVGVVGCGGPTYASVGVEAGPPAPGDADLYFDARSGYVWVEGRWAWDGVQYQWQPGYWLAARPGFVYIQGFWDYRGGRYFWTDGFWEPARPGYVYVRGYWGWQDGRRVWLRGRWQPHRRGHDWRPGYWDRQGDKRVWRPGRWERAQPRARDHRRQSPERVPSRRGRRR